MIYFKGSKIFPFLSFSCKDHSDIPSDPLAVIHPFRFKSGFGTCLEVKQKS